MYILFFFNDTATTEIYTLSLHDALPIFQRPGAGGLGRARRQGRGHLGPPLPVRAEGRRPRGQPDLRARPPHRSEEHTSELQSHVNLVCRLLLEKKKKKKKIIELT